MRGRGERGSVVTLICDPGDRYLDKYYADSWVAAQGLDLDPYERDLEAFLSGASGARLTRPGAAGSV